MALPFGPAPIPVLVRQRVRALQILCLYSVGQLFWSSLALAHLPAASLGIAFARHPQHELLLEVGGEGRGRALGLRGVLLGI